MTKLTPGEEALTFDTDYSNDVKVINQAVERLLYERTHVLREEVLAAQEREAQLVELAKEIARFHPGCVMPESYTPAMYGLAQAACALIEALGVDEHELARHGDETSS